jgi:hypothetical protein
MNKLRGGIVFGGRSTPPRITAGCPILAAWSTAGAALILSGKGGDFDFPFVGSELQPPPPITRPTAAMGNRHNLNICGRRTFPVDQDVRELPKQESEGGMRSRSPTFRCGDDRASARSTSASNRTAASGLRSIYHSNAASNSMQLRDETRPTQFGQARLTRSASRSFTAGHSEATIE